MDNNTVDNVENQLNLFNDNNSIVDNSVENQEDLFFVKKGSGFNETNLMVMPIISLKKEIEREIKRSWIRPDNEIVKVRVSANEYGVPKALDFDVLLALLRVHLKNNNYRFNKVDNKIDVPKKINFTLYELAKELGISINGQNYEKLNERIERLIDTKIETEFIARELSDEDGNYDLKERTIFGILEEYNSVTKKYFNVNNKAYDPTKIKDKQYVVISDFVLKNICGGYFKIYNETQYKQLKGAVGKRLYSILNSWSKSGEKFLSYDVLMNYIGFTDEDKDNKISEINRKIKQGFEELKKVGFIEDYEIKKGKGINIIYNRKYLRNSSNLDKYNNVGEIVAWFRGITIEDISIFEYTEILDIVAKNDFKYLQGFARYIDFKLRKNNKISSLRKYILNGLNYGDIMNPKYDVGKFMD